MNDPILAAGAAVAALPAPPNGTGPLAGLRVIDLSRVMAGNMLTVQLADLGADVIKVEAPGDGDPLRNWCTHGVPVWWRTYSRNKRSLTLNLRDARAMAALKQLIGTAQVVVENYRPGTLERMGLGPEVLLALQPRLILVRISGWGQTGPYRDKPGFGSLVEAYSGLAAKTGFDDRPPVLPSMTLADMLTGVQGVGAVLAALRHAEQADGQGQVIDLSLFDAMLACLGPDAADFCLTGQVAVRQGSRSPTAAPRNVYQTADGHWVALSATTQGMTERLFQAIGRPDLITDPRSATNTARVANVAFVDDAVQAFIGARDRETVLRHFEATEVTLGPVMTAADLVHDTYVRDRESLVGVPDPDMGIMPMANVAARLSVTPGGIRRAAPELGQDTQAVLHELGFEADELAQWAREGVI